MSGTQASKARTAPRPRPGPRHAARRPRLLVAVLATLGAACLGACTAGPASEGPALAGLSEQVGGLNREVASLAERVDALATQAAAAEERDAARAERDAALDASIDKLSKNVTASYRAAAARPAAEPNGGLRVRTIVMQGDKMVVGELERVWVDPPGTLVVARIDTGAASNSLHAENLVEFERDGEKWVRFEVSLTEGEEPREIERKIVRHVRIMQQTNSQGSRRPVVKLRVVLGDVQGTFDFTLADRSHMDNELLLGRNFLTDVAVVDTSRRFVQTPYDPGDDKTAGGAAKPATKTGSSTATEDAGKQPRKTTEKAAEKPAKRPVEKPRAKAAEAPVASPTVKPSDKAVDGSDRKPAGERPAAR